MKTKDGEGGTYPVNTGRCKEKKKSGAGRQLVTKGQAI